VLKRYLNGWSLPPWKLGRGGGESQTFEVCTFIFNFDEDSVDGVGDEGSTRVMVKTIVKQ